jgi:hypothetical protein
MRLSMRPGLDQVAAFREGNGSNLAEAGLRNVR